MTVNSQLPQDFRAITSTRIDYTSGAGETKVFSATGRCWYLTIGTDVQIEVWDQMNRKLVDKTTLVAGRGIKLPERWSDLLGYKVAVYSASAQAIKLDVIDGEIIDNSFIISSASAVTTTPSGTTLTSAAAPVSVAQDAVTLVSAAAADIQRRWVRNDHATISVWLRSNTTKAESAIEIAPGEIALVENQSNLYVYNKAASGASVDIYVDTETTT